MSRRVAALDGEELIAYEQLWTDTQTLAGNPDPAVGGELLDRSESLAQKSAAALGSNNLAIMRYAQAAATYSETQEDYSRATRMSSLAVASGLQNLGMTHTDFVPLATQQARLLRVQGRYQEALALAQQCVRAADEVLGDESFDTFAARFELAHIYAVIRDDSAALPLARSASSGFQRLWGDENVEYAAAVGLLGEIYFGLGERDLGYSEIRRSYAIINQLDDVSIRDRLRSMASLAVAAADDERREEEARELFEAALAEYESAGLTQSAEFLELLIEYGGSLLRWGEIDAAKSRLTESIDGLDARNGQAALQQSALHLHGVTLRKSGQIEEAEDALKAATVIQKQLFGDDSIVLAETLFQLAICEHRQGQHEVALANVEECLRIQQRHFIEAGRLLSEKSLTELLDSDERPLDLVLSIIRQLLSLKDCGCSIRKWPTCRCDRTMRGPKRKPWAALKNCV